jgi:hypothetical protein
MRVSDRIHIKVLLSAEHSLKGVYNGAMAKSILRYKGAIEDEIYENK